MIHPSAIIDPAATLADNVTVGPWTWIGAGVEIAEGSEIGPNVIIKGCTKMGKNNRIFQFSSIGEEPADMKYVGEQSYLEIGNNNIIREGCTLHRGTEVGGGVTKLGNHNLLMAYVHIAHDCIVGNHTVFANNAAITGHVEVGDWVILGGYAGVNPFLKIGAHSMIGGMTHVTMDVPAYMIVSGTPAAVRGVNAIGLERRGFAKTSIKRIRSAYKTIYREGLRLQEAIEKIAALAKEDNDLQVLVDSLKSSAKGIQR